MIVMSGNRQAVLLRWLAGLAIAAGLVLLYSRGYLTKERMQSLASAMPTSVFVPAYFLLPLFGFPISALLVASGLKLGLTQSIVLAVFGMAFHTVVAWRLARSSLTIPLQRRLAKRGFKVPEIPDRHQIWFTCLVVLLPGLPYTFELYGLALTNLPFRRYALIVWSFHVLNAIPIIGMSAAVAEFDTKWLIAFGLLALVMVVIAQWLARKLGKDFGIINRCRVQTADATDETVVSREP
jgi:uncharacterized membrane protein YdjX (TVP38/TMEM64 family)